MMRNLHPSPSEIIMTAMFHLEQDRGTSFDDIVKYAKCKYGLKEVNIKGRISSALKRGLKYKILYRKNGLYRLNRSIVKIPSKSDGNAPEDEKNKKEDEEGKQEAGKGKESSSSMKKAQRRKKKKSKELFLCPDCQVKVNEEDPTKVEGEKRYEMRPRKTPSRSSGKGEPTPNEDPKDGERSSSSRRKSQWKDFLKMGMSFRGRRSNKM